MKLFPFRLLGVVAICASIFQQSSVFGATVTYVIQDTVFDRISNNASSGGTYNGTGTWGMWMNGDNTSQGLTAWKDFTAGSATSSGDRSLQIGDTFQITVNTRGVYYGSIGVSLNSGNNYSSADFTSRLSGSRIAIIQNGGNFGSGGGRGSWYVAGTTTPSFGITPNSVAQDYSLYFTVTSQNTANVRVTGNGGDTTLYDIFMNGTAGVNLSNFSIWMSDDRSLAWNDNSGGRGDTVWKQTTTVTDNGEVQLGYGLSGSSTFDPGIVGDGLVATSTSTARANAVVIGGASGTAVILNDANTYTGVTTVNANATARASNASAFGTTAGGVSVTSGGSIEISGTTSIGAETLTLNGTGISSGGALRNTANNNSWAGLITLGSASRINSDSGTLTLDVSSGNAITGAHNLTFGGAGSVEVKDPIATSTGTLTKDGTGTLTLTGNNTYSGETLLNNGTILVGNAGAFGTGTMTINYDTGSGTRSLASSSASDFTLNNNFNLYFNSFTLGQTSGGTGSLTLGGSGKNFYLGNDASTANRVITVNGNHEIAAAVTGGANNHIVKQGGGQLTLSGANTSTGNIYIDSGTINLSGGSLGAGNIDLGGGSANNSINSDNATLKVTSGSFSRPITVNAETTSGGASGSRTIEFANTSGTATLSGNVSIEKNVSVTTASGGIGKLSGVISRSGTAGIIKTGAGTLDLGAQTHSVSSIAVQQGTLLLGAANQLGASTTSAADLNFSAGTTLKTALDLTGNILTLAGTAAQADTIFDFNSGSGNDFAFGSTTWYGGNLKLSNVAIGTIINFGTFTGNAGLTFNDFQSKVSFSDTGLQAQINFSGTSLSVAAIPEPRVYAAAAGLVLLIGWAEYKRRRGKKLGASR